MFKHTSCRGASGPALRKYALAACKTLASRRRSGSNAEPSHRLHHTYNGGLGPDALRLSARLSRQGAATSRLKALAVFSPRRSEARSTPPIHTAKQIKKMRKVNLLGREILDAAHRIIRPGVTTDEIDRVVHDYTIEHGAYPAPLHYFDFPKSVCTSVNEVVCHGIPDLRELQASYLA